MFTDTTGAAANSERRRPVRAPLDQTRRSAATCRRSGRTASRPVPSANRPGAPGRWSDATTSDWMWVDALNAFAVASDDRERHHDHLLGRRLHLPPLPAGHVLGGPAEEAPAWSARREGHAPVPTTRPVRPGAVRPGPRDLRIGPRPTGLAHFGVDVDGLQACQQQATARRCSTGSPCRRRTARRSGRRWTARRGRAALGRAGPGRAAWSTTRPPSLATLPVEAHLRAGERRSSTAPAGRSVLLDDGHLWLIGSPDAWRSSTRPRCRRWTGAEWDAYPRGYGPERPAALSAGLVGPARAASSSARPAGASNRPPTAMPRPAGSMISSAMNAASPVSAGPSAHTPVWSTNAALRDRRPAPRRAGRRSARRRTRSCRGAGLRSQPSIAAHRPLDTHQHREHDRVERPSRSWGDRPATCASRVSAAA